LALGFLEAIISNTTPWPGSNGNSREEPSGSILVFVCLPLPGPLYGDWYIYLHERFIFMVNVGKYTSPIECPGIHYVLNYNLAGGFNPFEKY